MRHTTPFFKAFGPLLFGRPKPGALRGLLGRISELSSLSKLQQAFGYLIPEALLAREKVAPAGRDRIFTPVLTFWAFLAQVLCRTLRAGTPCSKFWHGGSSSCSPRENPPPTPAPTAGHAGAWPTIPWALSTPTLPGAWSETFRSTGFTRADQ